MKMPLVESIYSFYPSLTKTEKKVADYILEHLENVMYISVTDLAEEAGVGETTVIRFCKKIGFKGYQGFKLAIAQNQKSDTPDKNENNSLIQNIAQNVTTTIENTASMISEEQLNAAIHLLSEANAIHFFGVGTSGITAKDAQSKLLRIGIQANVQSDPHFQAMSASIMTERDVVIGLSVSGSTRDTVEAMKIAKENGARTIAITYYHRSPITKQADIVLHGGTKEFPLEGGSLNAKIAQLFTIDLLCTGLALHYKQESLNMKQKTAESVLEKKY